MTVELVVARYNENLNWLRNIPRQLTVTVYDKNPVPYPDTIPLPNLGREAHTYLHHLVTRYEALANLTIFCQGKPFDHAFDFHNTLRRLVAHPQDVHDFEPFGHLIDTDTHDGARLFQGWSKNEDGRGLDMRAWHRALFGTDGPERYTFRGGAQFALTQKCALSRPRAFYETALQVAAHFPDAAHCFERGWPQVFGVENPDLPWLNGRETAYLKPVRDKTGD